MSQDKALREAFIAQLSECRSGKHAPEVVVSVPSGHKRNTHFELCKYCGASRTVIVGEDNSTVVRAELWGEPVKLVAHAGVLI